MSVPSTDTASRRRRPPEYTSDPSLEQDPQTCCIHGASRDRLCGAPSVCDESWEMVQNKRTIRAENEVEANKLVNNYRFGFRKWKSHVTERPFEGRSDVVKELYSELNVMKPRTGHLLTCGNITYVFLFGWWVSLVYFMVCILMFITIIGAPYGKLCWRLCCYFIWPFGKSVSEPFSFDSLCEMSLAGVFAPTMFSKAYGSLVCDACTNATGGNQTSNSSGPFVCHNCHYDLNNGTLFQSHVEPLVYSVSVLLPVAYIIGLIFTLKTHSHIYDIQVGGQVFGHHGAVVHWSRWRSLLILIMATVLMSVCADLATKHIQPILSQPNISQYFIGVTVVAMVPEIPEIVNGIQFALQNNISLSLEVGGCIAVQVCMLQIPVLVLFNAFYDVGFVLLFSDLHLWASIFSVILVNYIFMDGKSDYFQGTALVIVYLILLALYYFAPSPAGC
ncbi:low affinity vacuolar monovalent cation/H(+) antiporter-like [Thalassophryne amazonica]|uniref:low affinity vacuolar monovalent cation/H(+) antiporter-like n=1 Tax=Thalassophryne amazonica TaxID=390379 RepID=UPI001471B8EE|nr:low affinity vacuolar monovalent cation/H(+) antiporter-like [Thalassophryne amazonica]